jgi:hypothetical protein
MNDESNQCKPNQIKSISFLRVISEGIHLCAFNEGCRFLRLTLHQCKTGDMSAIYCIFLLVIEPLDSKEC